MKQKHTYWLVCLFILALLVLDQSTKILVKTGMYYNQDIKVFGLNWFRIHFIENPGMAFGMQWGGETGKIALTVFRIIASGGLIWFINKSIQESQKLGFIMCVSLIFTGAVGNLIDSVFYGAIFSESVRYSRETAELVSFGQGYAPLLRGKVVDMLYFPLFNVILPDWLPIVGGRRWSFFDPVFNVADSCITVGVSILLIFQKRLMPQPQSNPTEQ